MSPTNSSLDQLFQGALEDYRAKRFDASRRQLKRLLSGASANSNALQLLGLVELAQGRHADAVRALNRASQLDRNNAGLLTNLGLAQMELDQWPAAKDSFQRVLDINPQSIVAWRGWLNACLELGDDFNLDTFIPKIVKPQPDQADLELVSVLKDKRLKNILKAELSAGVENLPLTPSNQRIADQSILVERIQTAFDGVQCPNAIVFYHAAASQTHPFFEMSTLNDPTARTLFTEADLKRDVQQVGRNTDYWSYLNISAQCARANADGFKIVLLTDDESAVPQLTGIDTVIRLPRRADELMYARMCAYHAFLLSKTVTEKIVFLDSDVCLNGPAGKAFEKPMDIGLTYRSTRHFPLMPVNEGVILASQARPGLAARFFERCLTLYDWLSAHDKVKDRYGFDVRYWRGGQLSLATAINWAVPPQSPARQILDGVECRFLPVDIYNYTFSAAGPVDALSQKWAVHFKGLKDIDFMSKFLSVQTEYRKYS